ncbi:MAG: N-acetyltransferase family protein [Haloferacaceae archaeon]
MSATIRPAREDDAAALASIYAPVVEHTAISFETTPPTPDDMRRRVREQTRLPWLVCERDGTGDDRDAGGRDSDTDVVGYAYASPHSSRPAYRWTVHVSVYVRESVRRRGVGRGLYESLLEVLRRQGVYNALAVISLPNPASVGFHESFGFERVGVYRRVGHKHGEWRDVGHWQLSLGTPAEDPDPPAPVSDLRGDGAWGDALARGESSIRL